VVADINAAITGKDCPQNQQDGRPWTEFPKRHNQENGYAKSVGCMGGDETVLSASFAFGKMDQILKSGIVARSQALEDRFTNMGGELVGAKHYDDNGKNNPPPPPAVGLHNPIY